MRDILIFVSVVNHELSEQLEETAFTEEVYFYKGNSVEIKDKLTVLIDGKEVKFQDEVISVSMWQKNFDDFVSG